MPYTPPPPCHKMLRSLVQKHPAWLEWCKNWSGQFEKSYLVMVLTQMFIPHPKKSVDMKISALKFLKYLYLVLWSPYLCPIRTQMKWNLSPWSRQFRFLWVLAELLAHGSDIPREHGPKHIHPTSLGLLTLQREENRCRVWESIVVFWKNRCSCR